MTDQVQDQVGFVQPPPSAAEQQPGFVQQGQQAPAPAQASASSDALLEAVTALTKQMQATQVQQAPATPENAAPGGGLNALNPSEIEDPILRSMAVVMRTVGKGLDMDRVFSKALDAGDPNLLDIAYLREKGGENAAELIEIAQGIVQAVEAKSQQVTKAVHEVVGGEQNWQVAVAAFNEKAPPELRQVVAQMLDSRKETHILAGAKLVAEFGKSSGMIPSTSQATALAAAGGVSQALTKDEFQAALRKLDTGSKTYQQDRNELFARRQMGRKLGK